MAGKKLRELGSPGRFVPDLLFVKEAVLPLLRIGGDIALGPEMKSTDEVWNRFDPRLGLRHIADGRRAARFPRKGKSFISVKDSDKEGRLYRWTGVCGNWFA